MSPLPYSVGYLGPQRGWNSILSLNGKSSKDLCPSLIDHTLMKIKLCLEAHYVKKRTWGLKIPFGLVICTLFIGIWSYNLRLRGIIIAVWYVRIAEKRQYSMFNGIFLQILSQLGTYSIQLRHSECLSLLRLWGHLKLSWLLVNQSPCLRKWSLGTLWKFSHPFSPFNHIRRVVLHSAA